MSHKTILCVSMRRIAGVSLTSFALLAAPVTEAWAIGRGGGGVRGGGGGGGGGGFRGGGGGGGGGFNGGGGFRGGAGGGGFNGGGAGFNGGGFRGGAGGGFNGNFGGGGNVAGGGNRQNFAGNRPNIENRGDFGNRFPNAGNRLPNAGNRPNNGGDRLPNRGDRTDNRGNRVDNRGDRIDNRGDRINNQGDRINNRNDRINNRGDYWHNVHNDWYHGYWNGHWGNGWYAHPWASWGVASAALGLSSWAFGSLFYDTGYYPYYNPYYVAPTVVEYPALDYGQPIVTTAALPSQNDPLITGAVSLADQARDAFYKGDYPAALSTIDAAIAKTPSDTPLHEFRALVLFAMGRYKEAAGTLYAVLSVGPGWDWTTMSSLYPSVDIYTKQLRALEDAVKQNENAADLHFLLGYHYLTEGYPNPAARQFEQVVKLAPNDQVSRQLLAMTAPPENGNAAAPEAPANTPADTQLTAPTNVAGSWHAAPPAGGGTIDLSLGADGRFTWKYARPDKTQSFDGKYELAGTTLVLDYDNGGTMVGKVNAEGPDRFSFKMVGGPPSDPGLNFTR